MTHEKQTRHNKPPISREELEGLINNLEGYKLQDTKTVYIPSVDKLAQTEDIRYGDPQVTEGRQLAGLVIAGETVFGLVNSYERVDGTGAQVTGVSLLTLPIGINESSATTTAFHVDTKELREPREDGVVQDWRAEVIGRTSGLEDTNPNKDAMMSRQHFKLSVIHGGGAFTVEDGFNGEPSTNGTIYVDLKDIDTIYRSGDTASAEKLHELAEHYGLHDAVWNPQYSGTQVVYPH